MRMTARMKIVPLHQGHHDQAARLLRDAFNISVMKNRQELTKDHGGVTQCFAAVAGKKVIGTIRCHHFDDHSLSVSLLAVDRRQRNKGIATKLMKHAEAFMRKKWLGDEQTYISLEDRTRLKNSRSKFYEKLGYSVWPDQKGSEGLPLMYKWLKP
jgi:ribosomal protein S18 acetylase RimI-like enzyme